MDRSDSLIQHSSGTKATEFTETLPHRPAAVQSSRILTQNIISECERLMAESAATGVVEDWHSLEQQRNDLLASLKADSGEVFVVTAEHPHVPGLQLRVCKSKESADAHAAELINITLQSCTDEQRADLDIPEATATTWEATMGALQDLFGAAHCWAEVKTETVVP